MRKEALSWLEQAKIDLESATINFEQKVYYVASFLSQQAVEKALKAILIEKYHLIPKVHDLVFLAKKAGIEGDLLSRCDELARVYLETRYPDISKEKTSDKFTKVVSEKHLAIAEEVLQWVKKHT